MTKYQLLSERLPVLAANHPFTVDVVALLAAMGIGIFIGWALEKAYRQWSGHCPPQPDWTFTQRFNTFCWQVAGAVAGAKCAAILLNVDLFWEGRAILDAILIGVGISA